MPLSGYVRAVPGESPPEREARHRRVQERRAGPVIICHRGASAFAPENTLEAYAAAMDYGADGCEVDVRRTADGVLCLFHDDMLERLTGGFGAVSQVTYYELLSFRPAFRYGTAIADTRPPTFAALLALARQRAMLLHLDVNEPGLEPQIARMLNDADAWDQVVAVNEANAATLRRDPRLRLLRYRAPGLFETGKDVDPVAVRDALARPGEMIIVDDPRVAAKELKRPPYRPVPLPAGLREPWQPAFSEGDPTGRELFPTAYLRLRAGMATEPRDLDPILASGSLEERSEPEGVFDYQRARTQGILDRAWAAERLGEERGAPSSRLPRLKWDSRRLEERFHEITQRLQHHHRVSTEELLEYNVRYRSLHPDWRFHGLDGASAARALGRLRATDAVPVLSEALLRADPALKKVQSREFGDYPPGSVDWRIRYAAVLALGEIRSAESKAALQQYLALTDAQARELGPALFAEAARSLLGQELTEAETVALLKNPHPEARAAAILYCVDHPAKEHQAALQAAVPWALELPSAAAAAKEPEKAHGNGGPAPRREK